jgi:hypothetical protein
LANAEFLMSVTGNHLGVLPVYDALAALWDRPLVVRSDPHRDILNLADCTTELSHGNLLLTGTGALAPLISLRHCELLLRFQYIGPYSH